MKIFKYSLITLLAIPVLLVVAALVLILVIDPNDYRQDIEQLALEQGKVRLSLDGDIGWTFYPDIGFSLEKVTLYERPDSDATLASIGEAVLSLQLLPLLSGAVQVQGVTLSQLDANLLVDANGKGNWVHIAGAQEPATAANDGEQTQPTPTKEPATQEQTVVVQDQDNAAVSGGKTDFLEQLHIAFVVIDDSRIMYTDLQGGQKWTLGIDSFRIDDFAFDQTFPLQASIDVQGNAPAINASVLLDSQIQVNAEINKIQLTDAQAKFSARTDVLPGGEQKVNLAFSADIDLETLRLQMPLHLVADLVVEQLSTEQQQVTLDTHVDANLSSLQLTLTAPSLNIDADYPDLFNGRKSVQFDAEKIQASLEKANLIGGRLVALGINAQLDTEVHSLLVPEIEARIDIASFNPRTVASEIRVGEDNAASLIPKMAGKHAVTAVALTTQLTFANNVARAKALTVQLDDSTLTGDTSYNIDSNTMTANLSLDQINADNYLPPKEKKADDASTSAGGTGGGDSGTDGDGAASEPVTTDELYSKDSVIPLELLDLVFVDVSLNAGSIQILEQSIQNLSLKLKNNNGNLQVNTSAQAFTGNIKATANIKKQKSPAIAVTSTLKNVDMEQVMAVVKDGQVIGGKGNIDLDLKMRGNSVYDWVHSVSGPLRMSVDKGRVYGFNLTKELCGAIVKADGRTLDKPQWQEFTTITKLGLNSRITSGNTKIMSLDLGLIDFQGAAQGEVDLPSLDFHVPIELTISGDDEDSLCRAHGSLATLSWPVLCKGNALSTDPVDFCRPDLGKIQSRIGKAIQDRIDNEKARLQQQFDAEKAKLTQALDLKKDELAQKKAEEQRKVQEKIDQEKAALDKKKKEEQARLQREFDAKKKKEEEKAKKALQNELQKLF